MTRGPFFAVRLAGWTVCLPSTTPLEYIARAILYPLPLAAGSVAGLIQVRGQPVVVFDVATRAANGGSAEAVVEPSMAAQGHAPATSHPPAAAGVAVRDVLVVGAPPQAAALLIDAPPWPVPGERVSAAPTAGAVPPDCPFRDAIVSRCTLQPEDPPRDAGARFRDPAGMRTGMADCLAIDPDRLFELLSSD